jgi:hypothetical protein
MTIITDRLEFTMSQARVLIDLLKKFESGQITEDDVFDKVDEMSPKRSQSVVQINGYMKPFLTHFLRVSIWNELQYIKSMDKALMNMKKRNKVKGSQGYWFTQDEDFQEIAEDVLDLAVGELNSKYKNNHTYEIQLQNLNKVIQIKTRPDQYKHELWPEGFKFSDYKLRPW